MVKQTNKVAVGMIIRDEESFSEERSKNDFYPTPKNFIKWLLEFTHDKNFRPSWSPRVLDVGVGTGNWGSVYNELHGQKVYGVEKFPDDYQHEVDTTGYFDIFHTDIMHFWPTYTKRFDLVIGNPPYNRGSKKAGIPSTTAIVKHVLNNVVSEDGYCMFLLPNSFMHGLSRLKDIPTPQDVLFLANRINFKTEDGKGGSYPGNYVVPIWRKPYRNSKYFQGFPVKWE